MLTIVAPPAFRFAGRPQPAGIIITAAHGLEHSPRRGSLSELVFLRPTPHFPVDSQSAAIVVTDNDGLDDVSFVVVLFFDFALGTGTDGIEVSFAFPHRVSLWLPDVPAHRSAVDRKTARNRIAHADPGESSFWSPEFPHPLGRAVPAFHFAGGPQPAGVFPLPGADHAELPRRRRKRILAVRVI